MTSEVIIDVQPKDIAIALLEDKQLVELHQEKKNSHYVVGDVVLGKVRKIMPGLNAAFVDLEDGKDGFLHYLDLGPSYNSFNKYLRLAMNGDADMQTLKNFKIEPVFEKTGNLSNTLKVGQPLLAQISKE